MRPKKKSLSLQRETLRQLTAPELTNAHAAINVGSGFTSLIGCPATQRHSCFDSCYQSDCCLEIP